MRNGLYKAEFRTPRDSGAGVVVLQDGVARGGDGIMYYRGDYSIEGSAFTARLHVAPHSRNAGGQNVFGPNTVNITIKGTFSGDTASLAGTAAEAPGVPFQATLTRLAD